MSISSNIIEGPRAPLAGAQMADVNTEVKAGPSRRKPTHPGKILKTNIEALGLTVYAAAKAIGVTQVALHNVIGGKSAVSPQMALRLGKWIGNGPEIWMNLQVAHDLWVSRQAMKAELAAIKPAVWDRETIEE